MPPSSLLVAVDMESFAALRIEPHLSTATVYLDLYLFGVHIHVDFEHFPGCCQLKSLLEKFRILHVAAFLPDSTLSRRSAALLRLLLRKTHKFHTETAEEPLNCFAKNLIAISLKLYHAGARAT